MVLGMNTEIYIERARCWNLEVCGHTSPIIHGGCLMMGPWIPSLIRNSPFGHIYVYYTCETYFETFLVWPARRLILKIIFSFISNKKLRKWVWELKIIFYFLFLKIKNMMFSKNIFNFFVLFSLIFFKSCFKKSNI